MALSWALWVGALFASSRLLVSLWWAGLVSKELSNMESPQTRHKKNHAKASGFQCALCIRAQLSHHSLFSLSLDSTIEACVYLDVTKIS